VSPISPVTTSPLTPIPVPPTTTNPQSPIPTAQLYACLHRPPAGDHPADVPDTLSTVAREFSPRFECHGPDLVSIDVSGLDRLIGPPHTIGEELRRAVAARGIRGHVAIAATRTAALVVAVTRPGVTIVARGEEAGALAPIPLGILEKIGDHDRASGSARLKASPSAEEREAFSQAIAVFKRWGLTTLGELAALPPADLAARMGKHALAWQALARGEDTRPLIPTLDEERFDATLELEWPIEELEPLSFVLTRLLEPLSTRLERRDRGAAVLHVLLRLVTREIYARRLELPTPMRDVRTLRTLALLDLESHPPGAGVDRVTIVIDPTPGRVVQHTLFTRAQPTPEQVSTLLARLGALMGSDRFGAPAVVDSYRPGAFAMTSFAVDHRDPSGERTDRADSADSASNASASNVVSVLRRCRQPVPARVAVADGRPVRVTTDRRGFAGGAVAHCAGPWRTSGDWWETSGGSGRSGESGRSESPRASSTDSPTCLACPTRPTSWNRDEWDVSLSDGAVYRVFRDRDTDAWFIDAIVD